MLRTSRRSAWSLLALSAAAWGLVACSQAPPPADGPADEARPSHLRVEGAWSRPAPRGAVGAVYLTVVNSAEEPDRLLRARCPDAAATELHQVVMEGDRMRMLPVTDGLEVPAGGRLELAPGGHHLMVIDLARDIPVGDRLALTLELERAGELAVSVPIVVDDPRAGD